VSTPVSPSKKIGRYDIAEIMLKVALYTITTITESKTGRIRNYFVLDLLYLNYKSGEGIYSVVHMNGKKWVNFCV